MPIRISRRLMALGPLLATIGPGAIADTTPPDWHVVSASTGVWNNYTASGDNYVKNSVRADTDYIVPTFPYSGSSGTGGSATAYATLSTGKMRVRAIAIPLTGSRGSSGSAGATAFVGSRIFLHGPANVAGVARITMSVPGTFKNPDTFGSGGPGVYNSGLQIQAYSNEPHSRGASMVFAGGNGTTIKLDCESCSINGGRPLPATVTSAISFAKGQKYIDYQAGLYVNAQGAASADVTSPATFSIVLPAGFTHTSTLKIAGP